MVSMQVFVTQRLILKTKNENKRPFNTPFLIGTNKSPNLQGNLGFCVMWHVVLDCPLVFCTVEKRL